MGIFMSALSYRGCCVYTIRQHTDLEVSPSPDLVSGISYLRLCVYHRHLDSFKASWRQYIFARPTRHDSALSWLLRLLELRLTNFPTYLLTYLPYARLYSSVFSLLQKPANVRIKLRLVNGSEFQSEGPEVAKPRDPYRESVMIVGNTRLNYYRPTSCR